MSHSMIEIFATVVDWDWLPMLGALPRGQRPDISQCEFSVRTPGKHRPRFGRKV